MRPVPAGGRPTAAREPGLDVFRGAAVLLMFVVHARRLQPSRSFSGVDGLAATALDGLYWAEPFIAASFLAIAGTSLVLARGRVPARVRWWRRIVVRAAALYLLAVALFVSQFGVALPDLALSPGILSVIAIATTLVGGALALARPVPWLGTLVGGSLLLTWLLERTGACVSGLNAGPGGAVPLVGFTAIGALLGIVHRRRGARALGFATAFTAIGAVVLGALGAPWTTRCESLYPAHQGLVAGLELFDPAPGHRAIAFWNHSAAGFCGLVPAVTGALWLSIVLPWPNRGPLAGGGLVALIGRHALLAYVGHLLLLGLLELSGLTPRTPTATCALIGGLGAAAALGSAALEAHRQSKPRRTEAARSQGGDRSRLPDGPGSVVASGPADSSEESP